VNVRSPAAMGTSSNCARATCPTVAMAANVWRSIATVGTSSNEPLMLDGP
jgi:hypothetical protein